MKRIITKIGGVLVLLLLPIFLQAQRFRPPMDHEITFSGNYGEIRADHYHGGLDFKTGGAEGKVVRARSEEHTSELQSR